MDYRIADAVEEGMEGVLSMGFAVSAICAVWGVSPSTNLLRSMGGDGGSIEYGLGGIPTDAASARWEMGGEGGLFGGCFRYGPSRGRDIGSICVSKSWLIVRHVRRVRWERLCPTRRG